MADVELLPLPPLAECSEDSVQEWGRANVEAHTEALRAEVGEAEKVLRGALDASTDGEPLRVLAIRASNALYWRTERAEQAEARAERLAEALREARDYVTTALREEREKFAGHEDCSDIPGIEADLHKIDALLREQENDDA